MQGVNELLEKVLTDIRDGLLSKRYSIISIDAECKEAPLLRAGGGGIVAVVSDGYLSYVGEAGVLNIESKVANRNVVTFIVDAKSFREILKDVDLLDALKQAIRETKKANPEDAEKMKQVMKRLQGIYYASPKNVKIVAGKDVDTCQLMLLPYEFLEQIIDSFIDSIKQLVLE